MKNTLFFKLTPLLLLPYICSAQNLWMGLSHGLSLNLTDVNDFDALAFNPSHVSLNNQYHFNIGYQFGRSPLFIETGFGKSNYAIAFSIKDGDPVVYGFEKPMRVKNNFFALEIPIKIGYRLNISSDTKFFGSLGAVAMWSISPSVEHVDGSLSRNNDGILYRFDYQLQSTSESWNSTRLEFGFGASHRIGHRISVGVEAILGMGLHPIVSQVFSYKVFKDDALFADIPYHAQLIHRSDQVLLKTSLNYHFGKLVEEKGKRRKK
jgi:hypothetical protein